MNSSSLIKRSPISIFKNPIKLTFALSCAYWIYLAYTTNMEIVFDAAGYERLAYTIYHDGWISFFKVRPVKVALYPFIISLSMRIADAFSISYYSIQTAVQILFMASAQILLYKTLKVLNIGRNLIAVILLYFGFSPGIVNSTFSLFCEIITYPLVLAIILLSISGWKKIRTENYAKIIFQGILIAILFVIMSLVRQINEYVLLFYLLTIVLFSCKYLFSKNKKILINGFLIIITIFGSYHLCLLPYKQMNLKHNGYNSLTMIGSQSLYANAVGRSQPLTNNQILTFLTAVPGENVCMKFFSMRECSFWKKDVHSLGAKMMKKLQGQGISNEEIDSIMKDSALKSILGNPLQYSFLTAAEGLKMFFWESTRIGFVKYPGWLNNIFGWTPFKNGLRLIISLITFASTMFSLYYVIRYRKNMYSPNAQQCTIISAYVFCLAIIAGNIILHAPFFIVPRYAFPIAPLYLILIALNVEHLFSRVNSS